MSGSLDLDCFLLPERCRALPEGSRERLMASKCLQQFWHQIFDPCPLLLAAHGPNGLSLFEPFMAWADEVDLGMNWTMHLHLLAFITRRGDAEPLPRATVIEVLAATASRWARTDMTTDLGVLLGSDLVPDEGVIAWKCTSLVETKRVFLVRLEHPRPLDRPAGWIFMPERGDVGTLVASRDWQTI